MVSSTIDPMLDSIEAYVDSLRSRVPNSTSLGEIVFLSVISISVLYAYIEVRGMMEQSAQGPKIIIYLMTGVFLLILLDKFIGGKISNRLEMGSNSEIEELGEASADDDSAVTQSMNLKGVVVESGWVLAYIFGMIYVGFFTSTFLFVISYVYLNESYLGTYRRIGYSVSWAVILASAVWVLFVELLRVSSVFRLGFLP